MHTQQQANPELLKSAIPLWEIARAAKGSGLELAAEIMKGPLSPITDPDLYRVCVTMAADLIFKHTQTLQADKARLDWLEKHSYRAIPDVPPAVYVIAHSSVWPPAVPNQLRQAIDAAAVAPTPASRAVEVIVNGTKVSVNHTEGGAWYALYYRALVLAKYSHGENWRMTDSEGREVVLSEKPSASDERLSKVLYVTLPAGIGA